MRLFFKTITGSIRGAVFAFLAPHRCRACGSALFGHGNPFLCPACLAEMLWIGGGACRGCGYPAGPGARHRRRCFRCRDGNLRLTAAASVARYRGGARGLVKSLKFRGETGIVDLLSTLMARRLSETDFARSIDFIVPVRLHESRRRERGFDQALFLARGVGRIARIEVRPDVLRRVRATPPQAALRRRERLTNLENAFAVQEDISGAGVLLIDDVMTTGATLAECARVCREAGASRIYGLTFAR